MIEIDSSQLKCFINCAKRYENKYIKCLQKSEFDTMDIDFGSAIHAGLEEFYSNGCDDGAMKKGIDRFVGDYSDIIGQSVKTVANGVELLKLYKNYHDHNFSNWEVLSCEKTTDYEIVPGVKYIVKIDLVIRWNSNIYVVDFKTSTSKNRAQFMNKFTLDFQPSGYVDWCVQGFGECSGFIPIGLFMGFRKNKYKGEPAGFWFKPDYTIVNRDKKQLERFREEVRFYSDLLIYEKKKGFFPKNPSDCSSFRGCQYKELCDNLDDENICNMLYSEVNTREYLGGEYGGVK